MFTVGCVSKVENEALSQSDGTVAEVVKEPVKIGTKAFFVAVNGSDNNPGSYDKPWATWQKAINEINPGDTVYIRGGVYYPSNDDQFGVFAENKKGSQEKMLCVMNYPGETPVLDCSKMTSTRANSGIFLRNCTYFHLKGLTVTGVSQHKRDVQVSGFAIEGGTGYKLEQCVSHSNDGAGYHGYNVSKIELINCDAYNNYDVSTAGYAGGQADGFVFCYTSQASSTIFRGCRSWYNSDDGFDCWENEGVVEFDQCWAFNNGRGSGDGGGFKLGQTVQSPQSVTQRILKNCLAFNNRFIGFNQNEGNVKMAFYNNVAYKNDVIGFDLSLYKNTMILRNNISYKNGADGYFVSNAVNDHNSWNASANVKVTDADFLSLDWSGTTGKRQANGDLPVLNFLRLASNSDLIDAGVTTGLAYKGKAPDMGAFEK